MTSPVRIRIGFTFDYFFLGLGIVGLGIYLGITSHFSYYFLLPIGIVLFLSSKVIEFDVERLERRVAYDFFITKVGGWSKYAADDELWLVKQSSYRDTSSGYMGGVGRYGTSGYVHLFTIVVASDIGDLELTVFEDYQEAVDYLEKYSTLLNMKAVNDFEDKLEEARGKERR